MRVCDNCYIESLDLETRKTEEEKIKRSLAERQAKEKLQIQEREFKKSLKKKPLTLRDKLMSQKSFLVEGDPLTNNNNNNTNNTNNNNINQSNLPNSLSSVAYAGGDFFFLFFGLRKYFIFLD